MNEQKQIESALSRRAGMTPERREALQKQMAQQTDWYGKCRKCGVHLTGTVAQLKEHTCGPTS